MFKWSWFLLFLCSNLANATTLLPGPIDVNDVSYMWPPVYKNDPAESKKLIGLSQIISEDLFKEIISFSKGKELQGQKLITPIAMPIESLKFDNWRIVSMRIDPCAPGLRFHNNQLNKCIQEVRLVTQPFFYDGVWEYFDFAMHVILEISTGTPQDSELFSKLLKQLIELKEQNKLAGKPYETTGAPLQVHPGFKRPGFRSQLHSIVLSDLQKYKIKKITFTGAESDRGPWVFFQGLVINNHYQLEPDLNMNNLAHGHMTPELPGFGGEIVPLPTNQNWPFKLDNFLGPSVADLFFMGSKNLADPARLSDTTESKVFKIEDIIPAVNNPNITDRTNTDCFSCHTSMSREIKMNLSDKVSPFKYEAPNNHVTLKATALNESITNFRVFGWFGPTAVISNRVIFESSNVTDLIEKLF